METKSIEVIYIDTSAQSAKKQTKKSNGIDSSAFEG